MLKVRGSISAVDYIIWFMRVWNQVTKLLHMPQATVLPGQSGIPGDANGNGSMDIVDALLIAQYYVGLSPSGFIATNADTNCDGSINIVDALLVAQYYVGLITSFPC